VREDDLVPADASFQRSPTVPTSMARPTAWARPVYAPARRTAASTRIVGGELHLKLR
jgi:hypothetical protein